MDKDKKIKNLTLYKKVIYSLSDSKEDLTVRQISDKIERKQTKVRVVLDTLVNNKLILKIPIFRDDLKPSKSHWRFCLIYNPEYTFKQLGLAVYMESRNL